MPTLPLDPGTALLGDARSPALGLVGKQCPSGSCRFRLGKEMELMMSGSLFTGYGDSRGPVGYIAVRGPVTDRRNDSRGTVF